MCHHEQQLRFCTTVNAGFAGVRTVIFRAFSDEDGLAEVEIDCCHYTPVKGPSPELDERYLLLAPTRNIGRMSEKNGEHLK